MLRAAGPYVENAVEPRHALTEWRRKMDAMQKFLEYTSAYDDGSDTRIKLKIIHT